MSLPRIAIVTPSYNQGDYIRQTIESVVGQKYPGLEYRVKDGGSTDGTLEILRSYQGRFEWTSSRDAGQSNAINQGWKETGGEIVGWLNSDDLLFPGALQYVGEYFGSHPEIDWLYGDCDYIDAHGEVIRPYPTRDLDYRAYVRDTINYIPQPATFVRRKVVETVGLLDENLAYVMDMDLWLRVGLDHKGVHVPRKLAKLRLHREAKSVANSGRFAAELVKIYHKLFSIPDLPDSIRSVERETMHNIYLRAADSAYWGELLPEARRYAWRSFTYQPFRIHRLWLYLALGSIGRRLLDTKNPYVN